MVTQRQIIFDIIPLYRGGVLNDDNEIPIEKWAFVVDSIRALLIKREADKGEAINLYEQDIPCVEMEVTNTFDCLGIKSNLHILRSCGIIPDLLQLNHGDSLTYVGVPGGVQSFQRIVPARIPYIMYEKFTNHNPKFFILPYKGNLKLHIVNSREIEVVGVRGIFSSPIDASKFAGCCELPKDACKDLDSPYPISRDLVEGIKTYILNNDIKFLLATKRDETNNANDNK